MSKLTIPSNLELSSNAKKQLQQIETNNNYDSLVEKIQEFLNFASTTPMDLFGARQKGWRIEKLSQGKGTTVISIRITHGDRFTYEVKNGKVTILGVLKHYEGISLNNLVPDDFISLYDLTSRYYGGLTSFEELIENRRGFNIVPTLEDKDDVHELISIRERVMKQSLLKEDVKSIEFVKDDNSLYFDKDDFEEAFNYEEEKENNHAKK